MQAQWETMLLLSGYHIGLQLIVILQELFPPVELWMILTIYKLT